MPEIRALTVYMSPELRKRAAAAAKRFRSSTNHLIRESLSKYLDELDEKDLRDAERKNEIAEKRAAAQAAARRGPAARSLGMPLRPVQDLSKFSPTHLKNDASRLKSVLVECAKDVAAVWGDKEEMRRRVTNGVERVKKLSPLRHPPENEIVHLIENELVRLKESDIEAAGEPEREYDDLVGRAIDPNRVRTRGDVVPEGDDE